jgi:hypothetical protein
VVILSLSIKGFVHGGDRVKYPGIHHFSWMFGVSQEIGCHPDDSHWRLILSQAFAAFPNE